MFLLVTVLLMALGTVASIKPPTEVGISDKVSENIHGCKLPPQTIPFRWSEDNVSLSGYYFPIGEKAMFSKFNTFFDGKVLEEGDFQNFCLRLQWNDTDAKFFRLHGDTSDSSGFKCFLADPLNWILHCYSNTGLGHWVHVVKANPELTWALVYLCFDTEEVHWTVFSKYSTISTADQKAIMEAVEELGFEVNSKENLSYLQCYAQILAPK